MKPSRRNPLFSNIFRGNTLAAFVVISLSGMAALPTARAATVYWDSNGTVAGAGTAPAGTWGASAFWNATAAGTTTTPGAWVSGNIAVFSAGTDATGGYTVTLSGTQTIGGLTVEEGIPTISGGTALAINAASTPFNITGTATISSSITGATFGIAKSGSGTLNLNGVIGTTTGGLSISAGTLVVGNAANTFTGNIAVTGGALQMTSGINGTSTSAPLGIATGGTAYKTVSLSNNAIFRPMASYNSNVPSAALPGNGYVFSIGTGGGTFDVTTGLTLTLDDGSGTGTGTAACQLQGAGTLTKTGEGILSLGNGSSNFGAFTGALVINAGTLTTGAVSTTPFGTTTAGTTIASGATLDVKGVSIGAEPLTISGLGLASAPAGVITNSSTTAGSASGPVILAASASIGGPNAFTLSGAVSGAFELDKTGVGTVTLSGANTYSGPTVIKNGAFVAGNNSAMGSGDISLVNGGGTNATKLYVSGGVTIPNNISFGTVFGTTGNAVLQQTGTGQGRINGMLNISGTPTAGGHFIGGSAVGNELVLGGYIYSTTPILIVREGRVVFMGGGSGWSTLSVTNTAIVGATNGIPTDVSVLLGGSASATLNLNGFDQSLAGLILGNTGAGSPYVGTVNLGTKTLGLTGGITSQSELTQNVTHVITASAGGALDVGATAVTIALNDTHATDDLIISGAAINGSGGIIKTGAGTLALNNVNVAGPLSLSAGTLAVGTAIQVGSLTTGSLDFQAGGSLRMKVGTSGDHISTGALTTAGTTTVTLTQAGTSIAAGTYPLISYTGTSPGVTGFSLNPIGRVAANLVDTGSAIAVQVSAASSAFVIWDGTNSSTWSGATGNWKLSSDFSATDYIENDTVVFNDAPTNSSVSIPTNVSPQGVAFGNTVDTTYTISGAAGIIGATGLSKTGSGVVNLGSINEYGGATTVNAGTLNLTGSIANSSVVVGTNGTFTATGTIRGTGVSITSSGITNLAPTSANTYTGATTISAGTFTANHTTATPLSTASAVSVAAGATLNLTHAGGMFSLVNTLTGAGTVVIDPGTTNAGARDLNTVTWNASGFTGLMRLAPTTGTMRIQVDSTTDLGSGPIEIATGGQIIYTASNLTTPNNIKITGTGYLETAGVLGALRAANPTTYTGVITVVGDAKIGALGGIANVTNSLTGGNLTFGGSWNNASSEVLVLTGSAAGLTSLTVNDGTATSSAASITVIVGNGTTSGTLGTVPVALKADGFKNAVVRFDRSDGYTLGGAVSSLATAPANELRNYLDLDCTGTGFSDNGLITTLGAASPNLGGNVRIGQNRANSLATLSGTLTAETLRLATGQNNSVLNIASTAIITSNVLYLGDSANGSAVVNQTAGATVNVLGQVRVGHYATETSTYNLSGGTLTLTGASPNLTPSTAAGGGASATGDNNINGTATATIHGGGVYLGLDGTGILNHTGGTLTTNWIVLDNRGATTAGMNMPDGIDRYNISGSSVLNLRSSWGIIGRNDGSYAVSLGGGIIKVDNTGTGLGTGPAITVALDAILDSVATTTTTLDTGTDYSNAFTLTKNVTGTGTLALTGGGTVNLSTAGQQLITAGLTSPGPASNLTKLGIGTSTLTGALGGFTGNVTVSAGRLNVPASLATAVTVADGASLSGEPIGVTSLTLGTTTGATLLFDPNTAGALTVGALTTNGVTLLDVTSAPAAGTVTALNYGTRAGSGTFAVANATSYRAVPAVNDAAGTVSVTFGANKSLTWTGTLSTAWNLNSTANWSDGAIAETFYTGDAVSFVDGGANPSIAITGILAPAGVSVNANTTNYAFTANGTTNMIGGSTGLSKSGSSTLTLTGANAYSGATTINGGVIAIDGTNSIGSGVIGNSLAFNGGKLSYTASTALDLGLNRRIAVGTGGGIIVHNNATAANITIPGAISGSTPLAFQSALAGGGTFNLSGDNSGYTGTISVDSAGAGTTTLAFFTQASIPPSGSIVIGMPVGAGTSGVNALNLNGGLTLPAGLSVFTNVGANANGLVRNSINSAGDNVINSPLRLTSTAASALTQVFSNSGTLTMNGAIGETSTGSVVAGGVLFMRGTSAIVVNSSINLPNASVTRTDTGSVTFNSTGNVWASTGFSVGTAVLGATNALCTAAPLSFGQNDANTVTFNMAGFNQTVAGLASNPTAPGANTTGKLITTALGSPSTLTITPIADSIYAGNISGPVSLVKNGSFTQTLAGTDTYTGNVTVNAGTLVAGGGQTSNALGSPTTAARVITVNTGATLSFTTNNVFSNGVGNANLPAIVVNSGTLTSTRYNVIGDVSLSGSTLTQAATDGPGGYEGYQFLGSVTVGGTAPSVISSTTNRANHLNTNTQFNVPDVAAGVDLTVSASLKNPSGDFPALMGGMTKSGLGTMVLGGNNSYTGATTVNAGTLVVNAANGSSAVSLAAGATLGGTGTVGPVTAAGTIAPGVGIGTLNAGATTLTGILDIELDATTSDRLAVTGALVVDGATVRITGTPLAASYTLATSTTAITGTPVLQTPFTGYSLVTVGNSLMLATPFGKWAAEHGLTGNNALPTADPDGDGLNNLLEFVLGGNPNASDNASVSPALQDTGAALVVTFKRSNASELQAVACVVQVGTDIATWNPANDIVIGPVSGSGPNGATYTVAETANLDTVVVTIPKNSAAIKFVRVRAVAP